MACQTSAPLPQHATSINHAPTVLGVLLSQVGVRLRTFDGIQNSRSILSASFPQWLGGGQVPFSFQIKQDSDIGIDILGKYRSSFHKLNPISRTIPWYTTELSRCGPSTNTGVSRDHNLVVQLGPPLEE